MPANGHRSVDLLRRAACESRCREPVPHRGDLRGVRGLRLSSRHRRVAPPRPPREQQESSTAHARAWPVAEAAKALRHYDGQPRPCTRWPTKPSRTSWPICRASSISSTMLAGYTQLSATAAPSTSRINTPSAWSKPQHDAVHRKGRTPPRRAERVGAALLQPEACDRLAIFYLYCR